MPLSRTLRVLVMLGLVVVTAAAARAAETPTWAALAAMFGQPIDSAPMKAFVERYKLRKVTKGASGSFGAGDHSYTLMYNANQIDCIVLQAGPWPAGAGGRGWTYYSGDLPFGLRATDDHARVAERLGPPSTPGSGHFRAEEYKLVMSFRENGRGIEDIYIWKDGKSGG